MKVKLSDAFDLQMGKTPSRNEPAYWGGTRKWVSIADINGAEKYIRTTKERITDRGVQESGIKPVPKGTVIMSFKLSIGRAAITAEDMFTNEAIMAFLDKRMLEVDASYLYYLLSGTDWTAGTNRAVMGLTLNKAVLSEKEIDIPALDAQLSAVRTLDKVSALIALRKRQLAKLNELLKVKFVELFGDPIRNERQWPVCAMKAITGKIGSGATPTGGSSAYLEKGISLIRSMNVYNGIFEPSNLAFISEEQAKSLDNVSIHENDVLLNITGASVARCCIAPQNVLPARVNQHVCVLRCISSKILPVFLNQQLISASYQKYLWDIAESGGATRQAITKRLIADFPVIVPPLELQERFAAFVEQSDKAKLQIQQGFDKLETLKAALMRQYFAQS